MKKLYFLIFILLFAACSSDDDTQAPEVSILSPSSGELVSENLTVSVEAIDNEGIDYVELYLDDEAQSQDATSPYEFDIDLSGLFGTHTLSAKAWDDAGNEGESDSVTITIDHFASSFGLSVVRTTPRSVELCWNSYGGPFGIYIVRCSETPGVDASAAIADTLYSSTDTSRTIAGLTPDTDYYFKVLAVRTDELVLATNEVHARTDTVETAVSDTTMIFIPTTTFSRGNTWGGAMGGNDDTPSERITVSGFYIDKFEVTYRQYQRFVNAGGYETETYWSADGWNYIHDLLDMQPGFWDNDAYHQGDDYPVVGVSFYEAEAYANWAGKRLPTEAEWEVAARGNSGVDVNDDTHTDGLVYPWGGEFFMDGEVHCNFNDSESPRNDGYTNNAPIGAFPSGDSPFGVSDMSGNLAEWCSDWWDPEYYNVAPSTDPTGPTTGERKTVRGGSFIDLPGEFTDEGFDFRTFIRDYREPGDQKKQIGFRCVREVD